MTGKSCWHCHSDELVLSPFCTSCGAFQKFTESPTSSQRKIPISQINPCVHIKILCTKVVAKTPFAEEVLALRYHVDDKLTGNSLRDIALDEYEARVEPNVESGKLSARFVNLWLEYWQKTTLVVDECRKLVAQFNITACSEEHGDEIQTALVLSRQKVQAEAEASLNSCLKTFAVNCENLSEITDWLLQSGLALGTYLETEYLLVAIARKRHAQASVANTHITFNEKFELITNFLPVVERIRDRCLEAEDPSFFHQDANICAAFKERILECIPELPKVIDFSSASPRSVHRSSWILSKVKGLSTSEDYELTDLIKAGFEAIEKSIADLQEQCAANTENILDEFQQRVAEDEEYAARDQRRENYRQQREEQKEMQDDLVKRLVKEQQIARQMSEGKFGSAVITNIFGTSAGGTSEALSKP